MNTLFARMAQMTNRLACKAALCVVTAFASQGGSVAYAESCPKFNSLSRLSDQAARFTAAPKDYFKANQDPILFRLLEGAERKALERELTARYRSLDYIAIKGTLEKLNTALNLHALFGPKEAINYVEESKLRNDVRHLAKTIDQVCGTGSGQEKPDDADTQFSLSALITKAAKKKDAAFVEDRSHSVLIWLYVGLALLVVLAAFAARIEAWISTLFLKRSSCLISASLQASTHIIEGKITILSKRGLTFKMPKAAFETFLEAVTLGNTYKFTVKDQPIFAQLTYLPEENAGIAGFIIPAALPRARLKAFLQASSTQPIQKNLMRAR